MSELLNSKYPERFPYGICLFTRGKIGKLLSPRTWQATKRQRRHLDTLFVRLNGNDWNYDFCDFMCLNTSPNSKGLSWINPFSAGMFGLQFRLRRFMNQPLLKDTITMRRWWRRRENWTLPVETIISHCVSHCMFCLCHLSVIPATRAWDGWLQVTDTQAPSQHMDYLPANLPQSLGHRSIKPD